MGKNDAGGEIRHRKGTANILVFSFILLYSFFRMNKYKNKHSKQNIIILIRLFSYLCPSPFGEKNKTDLST